MLDLMITMSWFFLLLFVIFSLYWIHNQPQLHKTQQPQIPSDVQFDLITKKTHYDTRFGQLLISFLFFHLSSSVYTTSNINLFPSHDSNTF